MTAARRWGRPSRATGFGLGCLLLLSTACSPAPLSSPAAGTTLSAVPAGSQQSTSGPASSRPATTAGLKTAPTTPRPAMPPPEPLNTVGPLFTDGTGQPHDCTASVLDSPGQDLILTAAHCVTGAGTGMLFVPGYARGVGPFGVWQVSAAYVDQGWLSDREPAGDYAILRVAPQRRDGRQVGVQALTGGNQLGLAPADGQRVSAIAYNRGTGDSPVRCVSAVYDSSGQLAFDCRGFSDGTSGGPWLTSQPDTGRWVVRGLIGGLHGGGCFDHTSYTPAFTEAIFRLLARAEAGQPADSVPPAGSDC